MGSEMCIRDRKELTGRGLLIASRGMVVLIAVIAVLMALNPSDTILGLVGFAWAGFGAAFGPVVVASLFWRRLTAPGAMACMIVGALTVLVWGYLPATSELIYEMVPGVLFATIAMVVVSLATKPKPESEAEFDRAGKVFDYAMEHPEQSFDDALEHTPR